MTISIRSDLGNLWKLEIFSGMGAKSPVRTIHSFGALLVLTGIDGVGKPLVLALHSLSAGDLATAR